MLRLNSLKICVITAVIALAMIVAQIAGNDWFIIQLGSFSFPLWVLVAIYSGLQFAVWKVTSDRINLSDEEVARWGDKLEVATPQILRMYEERTPVKDIAASIDASHGIPPDVTLRYIIALGRHAQHAPTNE